jgi:SPP1 family predicted phage head-tail adaptor
MNVYRHRAIFQKPVRTVSSTGEETVSYIDDYLASVSIKALRGKLLEASKQIAPTASNMIELRYSGDKTLNETYRIKIGGLIYNVLFVDDVRLKHRDWEILVEQNRGANGDQSGY